MDDSSLAGVLPGTTAQADPWLFPQAGDAGAALGTGAGRFGILPIISGVGGSTLSLVDDFLAWLKAPITTPLSPTTLFLVVGIVIVAVIAWNLILYHIRIAAEAI